MESKQIEDNIKIPNPNSSSNNPQKVEEVKIKNQYSFKSTDRLGGGSFGQIYKGINLKTKEEVAIKIESRNIETPQLLHESKILKILKDSEGFPKVFLLTPLDDVLVLVMELLGDNLYKLIQNQPEKKFTLKTTLMLGIQILKRIRTLHENNFIHRDVKPENFTIGLKKKNNTIYMIDYGLTRKFCDSRKNHIPYKEGKNLTGTALYASIYTHKGIEQSRRDDLESLGYMLIYFCKGELPWMNVKAKNKAGKYKKIMEKKIEMKPEILCAGLIDEFREYFKYVRELQFTEEPNYNYLLGLLNNAMKKNNIKNDYKFDWCDNKDNTKSNEKFISTESLFSKLKLGGLNLNNNNNINENNDKNINNNNINENIDKSINNNNINDNNDKNTNNNKEDIQNNNNNEIKTNDLKKDIENEENK